MPGEAIAAAVGGGALFFLFLLFLETSDRDVPQRLSIQRTAHVYHLLQFDLLDRHGVCDMASEDAAPVAPRKRTHLVQGFGQAVSRWKQHEATTTLYNIVQHCFNAQCVCSHHAILCHIVPALVAVTAKPKSKPKSILCNMQHLAVQIAHSKNAFRFWSTLHHSMPQATSVEAEVSG